MTLKPERGVRSGGRILFQSFNCETILRAQLERAFPILNKGSMEEVKSIRMNLAKKENEIERQLEERDKSILNLFPRMNSCLYLT